MEQSEAENHRTFAKDAMEALRASRTFSVFFGYLGGQGHVCTLKDLPKPCVVLQSSSACIGIR